MKKLSRERFLSRLTEFEAGYVVGHLAGVGVWFQLLTALVFDHEATGESRLLLGEAFFAGDHRHPGAAVAVPGSHRPDAATAGPRQLTPRNVCIIPWERAKALFDTGDELIVDLEDGRLRIIPAAAEPTLEML